ncbi:MAG TPA: gliding motility-associated C-terminal domain-containing protein [Chitinophagales bacterium]|nr:gliding motility-associated C-terminal domain-containing protein [Chitinophagales bacterium]
MLLSKHLSKLLFFVLSLFSLDAWATHYRAADVTYELIAPFTYRVTIRTIAEDNAADRDTVRISWGDGTPEEVLARTNGPIVNGFHKGEFIGFGFKRNLYIGTHTFPGVPPPPLNYYVISFYDPARRNGITNINNGTSDQIPIYVEDTLRFPADIASLGYNNSPVFQQDPIAYGNVNQLLVHSQNPWDSDGDSLTFELVTPLQFSDIPVPNWQNPQNIPTPNDPSNQFKIDKFTGEIIWNVPKQVGLYNVGILVREYRRGILLGTLLRDFHIVIDNKPNRPPEISLLNDTCVRAGDLLQVHVTASDPDAGQLVTLRADGGPFLDAPNSLATFTAQPPGNPTSGSFSWQPDCNQVRNQPYTVVFTAQDNFAQGGNQLPLSDDETWLIDVVAPPVQNPAANVAGNTVTISWQNPYFCASSKNFRGFSVWRKIGSNPFVPTYCETGLDGKGYTRLNSTLLNSYSYFDNDIVRGQDYCYRILAHFSHLSPNGIFEYDKVESVPSVEICVNVPLDIPVITNVSVNNTDSLTGSNFVAWSKPRVGANQLDTLQSPPPYSFEIYQGTGFVFSGANLIHTYTANSYFALNDTTFTHNNLNTKTTANSYKIVFKSNGDSLGSTAIASSVFLTAEPLDKSVHLIWQENVPWTNDSFAVFKQNKATLVFDSIGVSFNHEYVDTGLINDSTYCYYVKSFGHYSVSSLKFPLINLSQETCATPQDTVAPCTPVLSVDNDCEKFSQKPWNTNDFVNHLHLKFDSLPDCDNDATHYNIFFAENGTDFVKIDSTTDTLYNHTQQENISGCYYVTAVDRLGNQSVPSNIVCIDNCVYYQLPNVFTPNGDGSNDLYKPFMPYRFVNKIELSIFNRWGEKVFETTNPDILWDGSDFKTGKPLNDGIYLYGGYYYETQRGKELKKPLPPNKKGGGYIHLFRAK